MTAFLEFLITQTVGDQRDDKTNQRLAEHGVPASRGSLRQKPVAHWLEPAAYDGLVAGSSTAGPTRKLGYCAGWAAHVAAGQPVKTLFGIAPMIMNRTAF
jgi:hypothetical protein